MTLKEYELNKRIKEQEEKNNKEKDEFAIKLLEWLTNEKSKYSIMYGNKEKRFTNYTVAKELLEIFKKENGL